MGRSVVAIGAGFVVAVALSLGADRAVHHLWPGMYDATGRTDSVGLLTFTLAYVALFAVLGCYLAARLAPNRPMRHALLLGALALLVSVVGTFAAWATAPAWYHVLALALVLPYAWLGGHLRMLQVAAPDGLVTERPDHA
jgi:hypothetical protein